MTRQLRRSRDRAARERRRITKAAREGSGHASALEKRALRLAGRPERLVRQMLDRELRSELSFSQAETPITNAQVAAEAAH